MTLRFSSRTPVVSSLALLALVGCGGMSAEELSPEHDANRVRTSEDDTNLSQAAEDAEDEEGGQGEAEAIAPTEQARVEPEPPVVAPEAPAAQDSADTVIDVPLAEAATPSEPTDGETTDGETTDGETTDGETTDGEEEPGFELEIVDDLSVLVIFDNSGSMSGYWDGSSRWAVANQALYDAFAPVATSLKVAAIRFPIEGECGVPDFTDEVHFDWQLAGEFLEEWQAQAVGPTGGTPMGQAFLAADEAIAQAKEQGLLEDRFNVIVLTDGEPNCETDTGLLTTLPAHWNEMGVKTHVLGLPGSSTAADLLNQIAVAGGTGEFVSLGEVSSDQLVHEVTARAR